MPIEDRQNIPFVHGGYYGDSTSDEGLDYIKQHTVF